MALKRRLVYSTDPDVRARRDETPPRPARSLPPEQQTVGIRRERKGRRGKTVTAIHDFRLSPEDLRALAKELKRTCGTGGTVKDGVIELQGDHREAVAEELRGRGYTTKFVGG